MSRVDEPRKTREISTSSSRFEMEHVQMGGGEGCKHASWLAGRQAGRQRGR